MIYIIRGKKGDKAFCSPADNVKFLKSGKIYCRDIRSNRYEVYSRDEIVQNPTFTGRECLGYKEILLK